MAKDPPKCLKCEKTLMWPPWTGQKSRPVELDGSSHICDVAPTELEEDDDYIPIVPKVEFTEQGSIMVTTNQPEGNLLANTDVIVTDDRRKIAKELDDPTPNKRLAFLKEKELTLNSSWEQIIMTELTKQTHLLREILEEMQKND